VQRVQADVHSLLIEGASTTGHAPQNRPSPIVTPPVRLRRPRHCLCSHRRLRPIPQAHVLGLLVRRLVLGSQQQPLALPWARQAQPQRLLRWLRCWRRCRQRTDPGLARCTRCLCRRLQSEALLTMGWQPSVRGCKNNTSCTRHNQLRLLPVFLPACGVRRRECPHLQKQLLGPQSGSGQTSYCCQISGRAP
jgi:hypothetical protein